jgi:hypothetical protein
MLEFVLVEGLHRIFPGFVAGKQNGLDDNLTGLSTCLRDMILLLHLDMCA